MPYLIQKLTKYMPVSELPVDEVLLLLDPRDHEAFFKALADEKLQN